MVSGSGVCTKRIVEDTRHHMLGRPSPIIAKELLNDQKVVMVSESSDRVPNQMCVRLSVTSPSSSG
jgi:hypothetical protein